jgi:hypothetical protein
VLTSLGKTLNGIERWCEGPNDKVFEVGKGSIDIEYEAPEVCENDTEHLSILNSCTKGRPLTDSVCHDKIQSKDFEITVSLPESLRIRPAKTEVSAGETIQIQLTDIKDREDKAPPPKKKILVEVEKGFLINQGQKAKALSLPVGTGSHTLTYEAPSECKTVTEKITVKNRCVDKSKKERIKTIAEKNLNITGCPEATLTIKRKVNTTKFSYRERRHSDKHCNYYEEDKYDYEKIEEAKLYIPLTFFLATDLPNVNQRIEIYRPQAINIFHFNITSKETTYRFRQSTKGSDCPESTTKNIRIVEGIGSDAKFLKEYLDLALNAPHVIIFFDRKTQKAVKVGFDDYDFHYQWNITNSYHHESWSEKRGNEVKDDQKVKTETQRYYISPVGDRVEDPTAGPAAAEEAVKDFISERYGIKLPEHIAKRTEGKTKAKKSKKLIFPDILVKHGDGITHFGGEGKKPPIEKKGVYPHNSTLREEKTFEWEMTRTIKEGK